jgi:hypothetical protein
MSKTNKDAIQTRIEKVAEHTTSGGHLGGTDFGQSADAKTTSTVTTGGDKARANDGSRGSSFQDDEGTEDADDSDQGLASGLGPAQSRDIDNPEHDQISASQTDDRKDEFPPFNDPAFSADRPGSPVQEAAVHYRSPPKDTQYAGHPDFSQDAAANEPPRGFGNSEPADDVDEETRHSDGVNPPTPSSQQTSGAGPAIARHSKDASKLDT